MGAAAPASNFHVALALDGSHLGMHSSVELREERFGSLGAIERRGRTRQRDHQGEERGKVGRKVGGRGEGDGREEGKVKTWKQREVEGSACEEGQLDY